MSDLLARLESDHKKKDNQITSMCGILVCDNTGIMQTTMIQDIEKCSQFIKNTAMWGGASSEVQQSLAHKANNGACDKGSQETLLWPAFKVEAAMEGPTVLRCLRSSMSCTCCYTNESQNVLKLGSIRVIPGVSHSFVTGQPLKSTCCCQSTSTKC